MTPDQIAEILFKPVTIGKLKLANRMVMGPMAAIAPQPDGRPSKQTVAFFEARARGGVGMIIVGGSVSTRRAFEESPVRPVLRLDREDYVEDFRRMADAVHAHGVPIIGELSPGFGRMAVPGPGRPIISASPKNVVIEPEVFPKGFLVPAARITPMPQEATLEDIKICENDTIACAAVVHRAGWDGVEIAAHMSYFAASFLSPRTNWRNDEYGGSVENRARMLANMVRAIRQAHGPDFVIGLRLPESDYMPDGQPVEEYAAVAKVVEAAGLDYVALSSGCYESMGKSAPAEDGGMIDNGHAAVFKRILSVPVLVQGLHDPARAAKAIADGNGDLVMLARPMLADPGYASKIAHKRPDTIVQCRRDNLCMRRMVFGMPVRCEVNPRMGRESRKPGEVPPVERILKAPVEQVILTLTGSKLVMGFLARLAKGKKKAA